MLTNIQFQTRKLQDRVDLNGLTEVYSLVLSTTEILKEREHTNEIMEDYMMDCGKLVKWNIQYKWKIEYPNFNLIETC